MVFQHKYPVFYYLESGSLGSHVGSEDGARNLDNNGSWAQRGTSNLVRVISIINLLPLNNNAIYAGTLFVELCTGHGHGGRGTAERSDKRGEEVKKLLDGRRRLNDIAEQAAEVDLACRPVVVLFVATRQTCVVSGLRHKEDLWNGILARPFPERMLKDSVVLGGLDLNMLGEA
ncbi:hypothetical protein LX32DRAFT_655855 [Colletotrichum zoysiae]|uniref:Uncharacterized protein n=1 Tax=Colletotrichum zoysiae TaxID=1216348 RepID=A0AAD9LXW5_9PEZI|nr:hypothetical protein LX32DRAFT_655855 [Colletotrichum zoysiae]